MILLWRPSADRLQALLRQVRNAPYTYRELGATRPGGSPRPPGARPGGSATPSGYRAVSERARLGEGDAVFRAAAEAVMRWQVQRGAGLTVTADGPVAEPGTTLLCTMPAPLPAGPLHVAIPCRVVYVVEEPDRVGFGYGTLPGHPARGEEAFLVERDGATVWLRVTAFSRPAGLLERLGGPVARRVQAGVTRRYLAGLRRYVAGRRL